MNKIQDAFESGYIAGLNAASGQGPADRPVVGRAKSSAAYADGWEKGFREAASQAEFQSRAIRQTRNRWAS